MDQEGPQAVKTVEYHCTGCKHLKPIGATYHCCHRNVTAVRSVVFSDMGPIAYIASNTPVHTPIWCPVWKEMHEAAERV